MKSPFGKLKKLGLSKSTPKEEWDYPISGHVDGLTQAAKDLKDIRACYDSLLSAAAATANSAYEFSESLSEMGNWLLENTPVLNEGECGGALSMLGKVQLDLQKLVDSYRSQVNTTITNPSESLLCELRKVEEMKLQCDEKREMFEYMVGQFKEKGKSKHGKLDNFTSQQLQVVREEFDEVARFCIFRVESLKQGQSRSLLTQAARHHAAQLNFFRKGLQLLESVESHIKNVAEKQHIDYELGELNDGEENGRNSTESSDDEELSPDHGQNKHELDNATTSRNSMEVNMNKQQGEQMLGQRQRESSHSAPIYVDKCDPIDRIQRTAMHKLNTHVLPTPADARGSIAMPSTMLPVGSSKSSLWHSSPLDIGKQKKFSDDHLFAPNSDNNKNFLPLPPPTALQIDIQSVYETRKTTRLAFSGPLASKHVLTASGPIGSTELISGVSVHNASPPLASSPKVSELHELPRPPDSFTSKCMPIRSSVGAAFGHSAPLRPSREGVFSLPRPRLTVSRSFSIPSSSQRAITVPLHSGKLVASAQIVAKREVSSPPLTPPQPPISVSKMEPPDTGGKMNSVVAVSSA